MKYNFLSPVSNKYLVVYISASPSSGHNTCCKMDSYISMELLVVVGVNKKKHVCSAERFIRKERDEERFKDQQKQFQESPLVQPGSEGEKRRLLFGT